MKITPIKTIIYSIVVFTICMLIGTIMLVAIIRDENNKTWQLFISRYLIEKNETIYDQYISAKEEANLLKQINFYSLDQYLDNERTFDDYNLQGMMIYEANEGIVHSYNRNLDSNIIENPIIIKGIANKAHTVETIIERVKVSGHLYSIVTLPLWTISKRHHITTVYIFDLSKSILRDSSIPFVSSIVLYFFIAFIGVMVLVYISYASYIKNIVVYIEQNTFKTNTPSSMRLRYLKPFDILEQKLSFLISHRKELEERYTEINERLYYMVHLTKEGIIMEDKYGLIYFCNQQFAKILDYDDEIELIGTKFTDLIIDEVEMNRYQKEVKLRQMKANYTYDLTLRSKNGHKVLCRLTANIVTEADGSVKGYYGTIMDISGTSTFSISEVQTYKIRSICIETNPNPIVLINDSNFIQDANDAFIDFVNKKRGEVISKVFDDVIKDHELEKIYVPEIGEFEIYEPKKNQWYFGINRPLKFDNKDFHYLVLYSFGYLKTKTPYHKTIFEDIRGFFFITTKSNQVQFLSQSFYNITKLPQEWFVEYYNSLIQASPTKTLNLFEPMIIMGANQMRLEFKLTQLYTYSGSFLVYQAIQK